MSKYIIECWNPHTKKYEKFGTYSNIKWAERTIDKPYYRIRTRRLIEVTSEVLYTLKANEK